MIRTLAPVAMLIACTSADPALLARRDAINAELEELRARRDALNDELVANQFRIPKLKPTALRVANRGFATPSESLAPRYPLTITRTGTIPTLDHPAPERSAGRCGMRIRTPALRAISDSNLNLLDHGYASPVVLREDGVALVPHAAPPDYGRYCVGHFSHGFANVFFSPTISLADTTRTYTLALSDALPLNREDGRPMYWVYPGTTLSVTAERDWDPSWGPLHVDLVARVLEPSDSPPRVRIADASFQQTGHRMQVSERVDPGRSPLQITIENPSDGPYVLVELLTIGNAERAVVVTSPDAWDT